MTYHEHYELVFIASRMGNPVGLACSGKEREILQEICKLCRNVAISDIWGVHSLGNCIIQNNGIYTCKVRQIEDMVNSQGEYKRRFDNSTTPFERDFLVYILAKRTNALRFTAEDHLGMVLTCCSLCRQGVQVDIDSQIHNNADCSGGFSESDALVESNFEKQCWVHRFWYWCHDPFRMERNNEII